MSNLGDDLHQALRVRASCGRSPSASRRSLLGRRASARGRGGGAGDARPSLVELAADPKVVGIGETGLDFYYEHSPRQAAGRELPSPISPRRARPGCRSSCTAGTRKRRRCAFSGKSTRMEPFTGVIHCFTARAGPVRGGTGPGPLHLGRRDRHLQEGRGAARYDKAPFLWTGSWSRPIRPTWRPHPSAASATSRPSSCTPPRSWPRSRASARSSWPEPRPTTSGASSPRPWAKHDRGPRMKVTVLGCGGSGGVPLAGREPGGHWGACDPSENPKNRRRRVSILVEDAGRPRCSGRHLAGPAGPDPR